MFNFTDTTFSGLLAILSALFGIAYPLVISCIEKIDQKYGSTLLTARFKNEKIFTHFQYLLIINLITAIIFPFLMDGCTHSRLFIGGQACGATALIVVTFLLLKKIMVYYDVSELQKEILEDYHAIKTSKSKKDIKKQEELYFKQWTDLTPILLSSVDKKLGTSVYEEWNKYINHHYKINISQVQPYDIYFYDSLTQINEYLCRTERRLISVNNENSLLQSFIYGGINMPELSYTYLWKNLKIQLYYDRSRWIMAYWRSASQNYNYSRFNNHNTKQKEDFLEFHIMLCAMVLNQKKYSLLQQMLTYSSSQPEEYPLVPSRLADIINIFIRLETLSMKNIIAYEAKYTMYQMDGIVHNNVMGGAYMYLTLLIYRLFTINWYYGAKIVLSTPSLSNDLNELAKTRDVINIVLYWIEQIDGESRVLKCLDDRNFLSIYQEKRNKYSNEFEILSPKDLITNFLKQITNKIDLVKSTANYSEQLVEITHSEITDTISQELQNYDFLISSEESQFRGYSINCFNINFYPREAFQENPSITYLNTSGSMASTILYNFYHFFASAFYTRKDKDNHYTIYYSNLLKSIERLQLNDTHLIISFGINWDFFVEESGPINKISDYEYVLHKKIHIYNLKCITPMFSQYIYIMSTKNQPVLYFKTPSPTIIDKYKLKETSQKYKLFLSLLDVQGHELLISKEDLDNLGESKNQMSMFVGFLQAELIFNEQTNFVSFQVKHQGIDEGECLDIEAIKAINF